MNLLPSFDPLGLPAPLWILFGLKVFGFWVHLFFMNLWFAGLLVGLVLARSEGRWAEPGRRLVYATPVFVALGVNAGVVPLLFLQVLYPQFFYTSTILQAWAWLTIIPVMIVAYYGIYVYVLGRKGGRDAWWVHAAGWTAATLFLAIGVMFATQMQFMTTVERWADMAAPAAGGTIAGMGVAIGATAVQRLAMMFGLALGTTAAYIAFDASVLNRRSAPQRVAPLVLTLAVAGLVAFSAGAVLYLPTVHAALSDATVWQWAAAVGPVLAVGGAALYGARPGRAAAAVLLGLQLASLLLNAAVRQMVQAREVGLHFELGAVAVDFQLSPIVLFLATLLVGLAAMVWLLAAFIREGASPNATVTEPAPTAPARRPAPPAPAVPAGG
jgi:hypothetical protein